MLGLDFMHRALDLAQTYKGFTSPNPTVGAVLVKGGKILGEGAHKKAGRDHAEVVAIKKAGQNTKGATLYVTLEPCCHQGKTPPCTQAIIAAGIKKVVCAVKDPSKKVSGKGFKELKEAGIEVQVLSTKSDQAMQAKHLNQPFVKMSKTGLPYVTLKAGMSLDGNIATRTGNSKWITDEIARSDARLERSMHDAVLVGSGTVVADNPELAAHGKYKRKKLLRIIIDPKLECSPKATVFRDGHVFVATTQQALQKNKALYSKHGIEVKQFGKKRVHLRELLEYLVQEKSIQSVYVEGGASIHGSFIDAARNDSELVDRVLFYIAPIIVGGSSAKHVVGGVGSGKLSEAITFASYDTIRVGSCIKWDGFVNWY